MSAQPPQQDHPPPLAGLLVVNKPYRLTSTSVVRVVKARLRAGGAPKRVKVGHGGTLDPLATGVLVVLCGKATKLCDQIMGSAKHYSAEVDLSRTSDTDDLEGEMAEIAVDTPPARAQIEQVLGEKFTGEIMQVPPAHSAVWVGGKRAYDLARAGADFKIQPRPARIDAIDIIAYDYPRLTLHIACGKGVYIRSIARDVGRELGTGGMLTGLVRTRIGRFLLEDAITLDDVPEPLGQGDLLVTPEVQKLIDKHNPS